MDTINKYLRRGLFAAVFLMAMNCFGGGFQLNTQGAKALGMGGLFTGVANDATCIYFNPAGMTDLKFRHELYTGVSLIFPMISIQTTAVSNTDQNSPVATPLQVFYAYKYNGNWSFGLGINNQFGSKASYPDDWQGRNIVQSLSLKTYMFQPTVAYKFDEHFSVGGGFDYVLGSFDLRRAMPLQATNRPEGELHLSGNGSCVGYNLGVLATSKNIGTLGINFRSKLKVDLKNGDASFTNIPVDVSNMFPASTSFNSSVTLPAVLSIGISHKFLNDRLTVGFDFWRTFWSSYDTLKFSFANPTTPEVVSPRSYKDVNYFGLGGTYVLSSKFAVRAGGFYDFSPIQDGYVSPELPDANTIGWAIGGSYKLSNRIAFDLSFLNYNLTMTRSFTQAGFSGTYHKIISVLDFGVNFSFGQRVFAKGELEVNDAK